MSKTDILVNVLLDRSGSMSDQIDAVIEHYNGYVEDLKRLPGKAYVSLSVFDDKYEEVYLGREVSSVPALTKETYYSRGMTSLLDAVGKLVTDVKSLPNKPAKVVFVINTDGFENNSREWTKEKISDLISKLQRDKDWQFLFIGAGIEDFTDAKTMGINVTLKTSKTRAGTAYNFANLSSATADYSSGSSATIGDAMSVSIGQLGTEDEFAKNNAGTATPPKITTLP